MYRKQIDQFFKENPIKRDTPTAQALAHFYLTMDANPDAVAKMHNVLSETTHRTQPQREAGILKEGAEIEGVTTHDQVIRFMRRGTEVINQDILIKKALEMEAEIVPEIVRRLKTSLNDSFTELGIRILGRSSINTVEELFADFDHIRGPYAQSLTMLLLGVKGDEALAPWLIERYKQFKRRYPNETYHEGAYYGLWALYERFYEKH